jgi:hypothetical protein
VELDVNDIIFPKDDTNAPPPTAPPVDARYARRALAVVPSARQVELTTLRGANGYVPAFQLDAEDPRGSAHTTYGSSPTLTLASPELLDLFGVPPALRTRLAAGDALVVLPPGARGLRAASLQPSNGVVLHVGGVVHSPNAALTLPRVLIGPSVANHFGWQSVPAGVTVIAAPHAFTHRELRRLRLVDDDVQWAGSIAAPRPPGSRYFQTSMQVGAPRQVIVSPWLLRAGGFGATSLFVLAIVGIGLGLSARDNEDERAVLDAVGAPPRVRRQVGTRRAVLLVVSSCVIALPAGLIPVGALVAVSDRRDSHFSVDWLALVAVTVALPLIIAAAAALGGRIRDARRPARPAAFAFAD